LKTRHCKNLLIENENAFRFMSALNFHFPEQLTDLITYIMYKNDCTHCPRNGRCTTSYVNDICLRTYVEVSRTSFTNMQSEAPYATYHDGINNAAS
jgi:hypothetical protein